MSYDSVVQSFKSTSKMELILAEEEERMVYKTWPERLSPGESRTVARRPSISSLTPVGAGLDEKNTVSLASALDSLTISYSPKTRGLHNTNVIQQGLNEHTTKKDTTQKSEHVDPEPCEVIEEDNAEMDDSVTRYVPCHRKAFSLPRTLEVVDELGAISPAVPSSQVESPRSTLLRYGIPYKAYNFQKDSTSQEDDSFSGISGLTDYSETRDSLGDTRDSGIFSEASSVSLKQTKKGFTEFLSMGQKLITKSSQQVARLIRKETSSTLRTEPVVSGCDTEAISSSGLIMEARPPGVPAKSIEEEVKHQRQHKELLEEAKRREHEEGRERQRRLAEQRRTEDDLSSLASYWSNIVLPAWAMHRATKKTQALWWKGLPPPVRGRVWSLALNNSLNLTEALYRILRKRAEEQLASCNEHGEDTLQLVGLDVSRTFPQLGIFQAGGPYHILLQNILGAYVCYRPDLGYVQGMSFIAAILLLNMDECQAFIVFGNLVNSPCLSAFYSLDTSVMAKYYLAFSQLLLTHLPKLAKHFAKLGLRPELYMLDWIMTLFSKAAPLDLTCRIWDLLFRDGEQFLFKAALGILSIFQDQLMEEQDFILLAQFLARIPESLDADCLFNRIEELAILNLECVLP